MESLEQVFCDVVVTKPLPNCEHPAQLPCSADPQQYTCTAPCGGIMTCCGRDCKYLCSECQKMGVGPGKERSQHMQHLCEKSLYCGHRCGKPCSQDHVCKTSCDQECQQRCPHAKCKSRCSKPCAPCMEPCMWACPHRKCPVPCGSVSPSICCLWRRL
jgi:hypothetical protein